MISKSTCFKVYACILLGTMLATAKFSFAQIESIDARARGTSTQMGKDFDIRVSIESFSTPEDRATLKAAFQKDGNEGLFKALSRMKSVGRIRIPSTVGYSLAYARSIPTPTGRKIRFVADRPIAFAEAFNNTRSQQYSLTCGEVEINDQDKNKSTGVLYPTAKLRVNKDGELEFELFQNPWKLVNIIDWTKGKD